MTSRYEILVTVWLIGLKHITSAQNLKRIPVFHTSHTITYTY